MQHLILVIYIRFFTKLFINFVIDDKCLELKTSAFILNGVEVNILNINYRSIVILRKYSFILLSFEH